MKLLPITEIDDSNIQVYKLLRDKILDKEGGFIADSPKVVNVLLQSDIEVKSIFATQEYYDQFSHLVASKEIESCYVADKALMEQIVGHKVHHNCMMYGVRPQPVSLDDLGDGIVMLDGITSTQNLGSITRSMAGFGIDSLLVASSSPHPYARRALRVSMGYMNSIKYSFYDDIFTTCKALQAQGYEIIAAELSENSELLCEMQVPKKWVLIMGHEGHGIAKEVLDICDRVVSIEMNADVKSLNVSVAASIIMHKFSQCKKG